MKPIFLWLRQSVVSLNALISLIAFWTQNIQISQMYLKLTILFSALPAFLIVYLSSLGLSRLLISQISKQEPLRLNSFVFVVMPLLPPLLCLACITYMRLYYQSTFIWPYVAKVALDPTCFLTYQQEFHSKQTPRCLEPIDISSLTSSQIFHKTCMLFHYQCSHQEILGRLDKYREDISLVFFLSLTFKNWF